jgi:hypothetical protein
VKERQPGGVRIQRKPVRLYNPTRLNLKLRPPLPRGHTPSTPNRRCISSHGSSCRSHSITPSPSVSGTVQRAPEPASNTKAGRAIAPARGRNTATRD